MAGAKRSVDEAFGSSHQYELLQETQNDAGVITYVSDARTTKSNRVIFYNREAPATKKRREVKTAANHNKAVNTRSMTTRAITTDASRKAVLNTPELLENIIARLPLPNILHLRRVCRYWGTLIAKSPKIMRKLFIRPILRPTAWVMDKKLATLYPYTRLTSIQPENGRYVQSYPTTLNPHFFTRRPGNAESQLLYRTHVCEDLRFSLTPELVNRGSVYHSMLLCQPPVETVTLAIRYRKRKWRRAEDELARIEVKNPSGVRLRDVLAAISAVIQQKIAGDDERDYTVHAGPRSTHGGSLIWMSGATFASEEEKRVVGKLRVTEVLSEETAEFIRGMEREPSLDLKEKVVEEKAVVCHQDLADSFAEIQMPVSP